MTLARHVLHPGCGCGVTDGGPALVGFEDALGLIAASVPAVETAETVALSAARGRVLAEPARCRAALPPFDNAAMDGYALRLDGLTGPGPWTLTVADRIAAGQPAGEIPEGPMAVRIFTGAPVPPGTEAVVMQERTRRDGARIRLDKRPRPGENIRRAGEEAAAGSVVVPAGRRLAAREIAALAAAGLGTVHVRRRLRVALLTTGDETRPAGGALDAAQIWDVNTPMLAAALSRPDIQITGLCTAADDAAAIRARIAALAAGTDLLVTTGGISVGEEDHVRPALDALGLRTRFTGVAIKPGKPVSFGALGPALWLGLPGNPVSAFVCWRLFGPAILARLSGDRTDALPRRKAVLGAPLRHAPGRTEFRPAAIAGHDACGRPVLQCDDATHSGRATRLASADGLAILPASAQDLPRGAELDFLPLAEH